MPRALFVVTVLAGCYSPSVQEGAPCSVNGSCPSGQQCYSGTCLVHAPGEDATDAAIDVPSDGAPPVRVWSVPTKIPGVNTNGAESDPCMAPDQLTIVFARGTNLYIGTRATKTAAFAVTELTALSSTADDASPELTGNGTTIYFTSDRLTAGKYDVFRSTFMDGEWQPPLLEVGLSDPVASDGDIAISPDGLTAFVVRGGGLMKATRTSTLNPWSAPVATGTTWGADAAAPSINSAGDVYLHAKTPRDIMFSRRMGSTYATPVPVSDLDTAGRDAAPNISPDDQYLWFERDGDLYESHR